MVKKKFVQKSKKKKIVLSPFFFFFFGGGGDGVTPKIHFVNNEKNQSCSKLPEMARKLDNIDFCIFKGT